MLTEVFLTFLVSSACGFCLIVAKLTYKSKCHHIKLCCVEIERDTQLEEKIDEIESQRRVTNTKSQDNLNSI